MKSFMTSARPIPIFASNVRLEERSPSRREPAARLAIGTRTLLRNWWCGRKPMGEVWPSIPVPSSDCLAALSAWRMRRGWNGLGWLSLTREQKRKFPPICPDFVVELTSPSDRLPEVQEKMSEWMENGTRLGWLIDADARTAYIYRPGLPVEKLIAPEKLVGEAPVAGF